MGPDLSPRASAEAADIRARIFAAEDAETVWHILAVVVLRWQVEMTGLLAPLATEPALRRFRERERRGARQ